MNSKIIIYIVLVFLLFDSRVVFGQVRKPDDGEYRFILRVKQLDEFIRRFNLERMPDNTVVPEELVNHENRKEYIASLFNYELLGSSDSLKNLEIDSFISSVVASDEKLKIGSSGIIAEVPVQVALSAENQPAILFFEMERSEEGYVKWVLTGIQVSFLEHLIRDDSSVFFPPNLDGNKFSSMSKWLNAEKNAIQLYPESFRSSLLLAEFYSLVSQGKVEVVSVNTADIRYHILQLKDWVFVLDYFNREDENSGWLISSFSKKRLSSRKYLDQLINNN